MKIAYCGYDYFYACLNQLLADKHDVYRVFTVPCDNRYNFNQYVRDICKTHNISLSEERVDEAIIKELETEGCELLITAAYYHKIPSLSATHIKGINIHPTLLPVGRGVWPLPWAILTDQKQSGVTIHKLSQEFDAGDILLQKSFALTSDERLESLSAKVQLLAKDLLSRVVNDFDPYWNNACKQEGSDSHWGYPSRKQRTLDWNDGIKDLDRVCRAFGKFGCFANFDDKDWVVYQLTGWKQLHKHDLGSIVHKTNTEMIVAASDGLVSLLYFEPASN